MSDRTYSGAHLCGRPKIAHKSPTYVAAHRKHGWELASFQNTRIQGLLPPPRPALDRRPGQARSQSGTAPVSSWTRSATVGSAR
ncbi:hypothetical protein FB157_14526 [Streptomyces sp. BK340]|nr:hypothetical protein FB157_14526 [Streptomyces sp. BK340]